MDLKSLLGKLDQLNEAEMTSRKISGKAYGGSAQADDEDDEDGEKKPAAPAVKRGRGRPRKAGGEAQTKAGYGGAAELQRYIVGSVPKKSKELEKLGKTKHKLSDKEPEKKKVKESLKDWISEAEQLTIEPAKASTQVIKQGTKVLGQVSNPQLASTIKQAIGKGEMSLAGADLEEADYSAKAARAGKDIGKPGKMFSKIAKSAGERYGSKERGEKVAGAVLAKLRSKTNEADIYTDGMNSLGAGLGAGRSDAALESKQGVTEEVDTGEYQARKSTPSSKEKQDKVHAKHRERMEKLRKEMDDEDKKKSVTEGMDQRLKAAHHRGKAHALAKEGYNCRYDEGTEEARMYHEGYKMGLDECYGIMPMRGVVVGEEDMDEGMMGATLGGIAGAALGKTPSAAMTGAKLGSAVQDQFANEDMDQDTVDDMASFGARHGEHDMEEGNAFTAALAKTPKGGKFSVGGKTFTDKTNYDAKVDEMMMAFESWDKQLNELLTEGEKVEEGMSVSVSKGQQGMPDSVSITASDADADQLMSLVRQMGVLGKEEHASDYGAPVSQPIDTHGDIEVVGDHDGMLAMMKKMAGMENSEDYADEEGHDHEEHGHEEHDGACDTCGEVDCSCDDTEMVEDETEDQMEFKVDEDSPQEAGAEEEAETTADEDAEAKEDEAIATDNIKEEELEEAYANGADDVFMADSEFMLDTISGGLNKKKTDIAGNGQTTIPVTAVRTDESITDWLKLAGIK